MIEASLLGTSARSKSEAAFSLFERSRFGEKKGQEIEYSSYETLFLVENGKMEVYDKAKKASFEELSRKLKKHNPKLITNYSAFADLRTKGYIVKTGFKFGAEFRVYKKGAKPGQDHATWLLYPVKEHEMLSWHDFSAKNRVATTTKKKLLIGVVDNESQVIYYEVAWFKP